MMLASSGVVLNNDSGTNKIRNVGVTIPPTTPPSRRRRVAPYCTTTSTTSTQTTHPATPPDVISSFESFVQKKNQQRRILEQFYHHKAIAAANSSSPSSTGMVSSSQTGTIVPPPSRTREWRLQRFRQQQQQNYKSYTGNESCHEHDIKRLLSSISEEDRSPYTTGVDTDEIDGNDDDDDDDDHDALKEEEEEEENDDDETEEEDDASWSSRGTDDALESTSHTDGNYGGWITSSIPPSTDVGSEQNTDNRSIVPTNNTPILPTAEDLVPYTNVSIRSLIQNTTNQVSGEDTSVVTDDSLSLVSTKSTDAIGSVLSNRRPTGRTFSLFQCLTDSGPIVMRDNAFHPFRDRPMLLLPSPCLNKIEVEDDVTIKHGNVSPQSSTVRLRVSRVTETITNIKKTTSKVNDTEKDENKRRDLTFDELSTVFKKKIVGCSRALEKNVKRMAKKIKDRSASDNGTGPKTYYMNVTSTANDYSSTKTQQHERKHVATFLCTTLLSGDDISPIFVLVDGLQEQPQALCIPSSYNRQIKKLMKSKKIASTALCQHIDESLVHSYVVYGRKQFRHGNSITPVPTSGRQTSSSSSSQCNDQEIYRQQYYQRTGQSQVGVGGALVALSSPYDNVGSKFVDGLLANSTSYDMEGECFYYEGYKYYPWMRVVGTNGDNPAASTGSSCPTRRNNENTNIINRPTSAFFQLWNGKQFVDIKQSMTISKSYNAAARFAMTTTKGIPIGPSTRYPVQSNNKVGGIAPTAAAAMSYGDASPRKSILRFDRHKKSKEQLPKAMVISRIELSDTVRQSRKNNNSTHSRSNKGNKTITNDDEYYSRSQRSLSSLSSSKSSSNICVMSLSERFYTKRTSIGTTLSTTTRTSKLKTKTTKTKVEEDGWDLQIQPGVDPALMLCLTVILDEMM